MPDTFTPEYLTTADAEANLRAKLAQMENERLQLGLERDAVAAIVADQPEQAGALESYQKGVALLDSRISVHKAKLAALAA